MRDPSMLRLLPCSCLLACLLFCSCDDTVRSEYPTRADAVADTLFERGWLPDIIPASSRDILTVNDLDLNTSHGEFSFDPAEAPVFMGRMTRRPSADKGRYQGFTFEAWRFLVDPKKGHCRYWL